MTRLQTGNIGKTVEANSGMAEIGSSTKPVYRHISLSLFLCCMLGSVAWGVSGMLVLVNLSLLFISLMIFNLVNC